MDLGPQFSGLVYDFSKDGPVKERHALPPTAHQRMVSEYHDARDAWEKNRETGDHMRMEDDEYREHAPPPTLKSWMMAR